MARRTCKNEELADEHLLQQPKAPHQSGAGNPEGIKGEHSCKGNVRNAPVTLNFLPHIEGGGPSLMQKKASAYKVKVQSTSCAITPPRSEGGSRRAIIT